MSVTILSHLNFEGGSGEHDLVGQYSRRNNKELPLSERRNNQGRSRCSDKPTYNLPSFDGSMDHISGRKFFPKVIYVQNVWQKQEKIKFQRLLW